PAGHPLEEGAPCSGNLLDDFLELEADLLDLPEVGTQDLDAHRRADPGRDHVDARLDWEEPGIRERRHLYGPVHLVDGLLPPEPPLFRPDSPERRLERVRHPR